MDEKKLCNRIKALHSRIIRDMNKNISPKKCNEYVEDIELLKKEMYYNDYEWIDNYESVEEVSEGGFFLDTADESEIHVTLEKTASQLERMLSYMGIDISEHPNVNQSNDNIPSINIYNTPTAIASANTQVSVEVKQKVDRLVKEFEEESRKVFPNKSKLNRIVDTLKNLGPYAAPFVTKFTEHLGKFW